jgi:hypothetical protein
VSTDEAFEALCAVCGIDWQGAITSDQRGRVNAALKQLRSIYTDDVTLPMMIHERAAAWNVVYPAIPLTPQALTGNWSSILAASEEVRQKVKADRQVTNAWAKNGCTTCQDDHMVIVGEDKNGNDVAVRCWACSGGEMPLGWRTM